MKKFRIVILFLLTIGALSVPNTFARKERPDLPNHYLTFSFVIHPASVGYKHRVSNSTYLTANLDYADDRNDITFQVGAGYIIPRKFWIFWFYGGSGLQFSRNRAYEHPYITLGTRFWVLYSEVVYPVQIGADTGFRFGFSVTF